MIFPGLKIERRIEKLMRTVELLGPSGVGKTFLYQKIFDASRKRDFLSIKEAYSASALSYRQEFALSEKYLLYTLLRTGLFKKKEQGIASKILAEEDLSEDFKSYKIACEVLKNYLLEEETLAVVLKRLENFTDVIKRDIVMNKRLDQDQLVFFDEGMLHHHHGLNIELLTKYTKEEIGSDRALNPSAIVSCELSFEMLMDRIKMRKASGIKTFSHGFLSGPELESYVFKNRNEYSKKIELMEKIGVPVLKISTGKDAVQNADEITFFINNLN